LRKLDERPFLRRGLKVAMEKIRDKVSLTEEQEKEGYWTEVCQDRMLVWHKKSQIALLYMSPDIEQKVHETIERRRKELKEVEAKTGCKPD
jgi:hypothetical protein